MRHHSLGCYCEIPTGSAKDDAFVHCGESIGHVYHCSDVHLLLKLIEDYMMCMLGGKCFCYK